MEVVFKRSPDQKFHGKVVDRLGIACSETFLRFKEPVDEVLANHKTQATKQFIRRRLITALTERIAKLICNFPANFGG